MCHALGFAGIRVPAVYDQRLKLGRLGGEALIRGTVNQSAVPFSEKG